MKKLTIADIREGKMIIFSAVMGSKAYGTNTPESDVDIRGVYVQPLDSILGLGYVDQVSDETNDTTYYEIKRFLELLQLNNPNVLEMVSVPDDCVIHKDPIMDVILKKTDLILTKKCRQSFCGYALEQIKKARGLNKKMNWEESEMTRKTVLDFCYIVKPDAAGTIPFNEFIKFLRSAWPLTYAAATQKSFGLSKIDHARDCYGLHYVENEEEFKRNSNYAGVVYDLETSNDVHLTSFSKDCPYVAMLVFNKDAYSSHCKRYVEYQTWLKNRNPNRVKMNKAHGKNYDGKNLSHCIRLLTVGTEIAEGKGIIVRRSPDEIKKLLSIKRGEYEFEDLITEADDLMSAMTGLYEHSDLPEEVDAATINDMLVTIRKGVYSL